MNITTNARFLMAISQFLPLINIFNTILNKYMDLLNILDIIHIMRMCICYSKKKQSTFLEKYFGYCLYIVIYLQAYYCMFIIYVCYVYYIYSVCVCYIWDAVCTDQDEIGNEYGKRVLKVFFLFFLYNAISLPRGQLWAIIEGTVSLSRCSSQPYYQFSTRGSLEIL